MEHLEDVDARGRYVHGRREAVVGQVGVGARLEQHRNHVDVDPFGYGVQQRRPPWGARPTAAPIIFMPMRALQAELQAEL